jgi:hypothetical protein
MAAASRPQERFGYSFARFVIATAAQLPADGLQRHFQIGGGSSVKFRHET